MSFRNWLNCFTISIALLSFLFLFSSNIAFTQEEKPVAILIDDFEALCAIPSEFEYLEKAGPVMLWTALSKAASDIKGLRFILVEREKALNKLLEEAGGVQQELPKYFNESTVKALQAVGADYVIFAKYFVKGGGKRVRVDAKMAKVEVAASEISEFHEFSPDDPDPLQPLGDMLVETFSKKAPDKYALPEIFQVLILAFNYKGIKVFEDIKEDTPDTLVTLLNNLKFKKMKCILDDIQSTQEKTYSCHSDLLVANPNIDYFIIGKITVSQLEGIDKAWVYIKIFNRKGETISSREDLFEIADLQTNREKTLQTLVQLLKDDWDNKINKND